MIENPLVAMAIEDAFMKKFKFYKSCKHNESYDQVISVFAGNGDTTEVMDFSGGNNNADMRVEILGLQKPEEWQLFVFPKHPGLVVIRNPFTSLGQRYWIRRCLEEYPKKPNKLNIDIDTYLYDWWSESHKNGQCNKQLLKKLRWTTLGYHHNWDTKVYSEENRSLFPEDLAELSDVFAKYLGYENFKAEAAIVNYYHMNSTLSAHTDHSEINLEAPLFSFSFGQSAIFLLGGRDKSVVPSAIRIDSGDVIVMSKEARLCYHAVPKILKSPISPWNDEHPELLLKTLPEFKYISDVENMIPSINENCSNIKWRKFSKYVQESRINMNVRQVLKQNQRSLNDTNFIDI